MILGTDKKGIPVFMTGGRIVSYSEGFKKIKMINRLTSKELAEVIGISERTMEGWIWGKKPGLKRLLALKTIMDKNGYIKK